MTTQAHLHSHSFPVLLPPFYTSELPFFFFFFYLLHRGIYTITVRAVFSTCIRRGHALQHYLVTRHSISFFYLIRLHIATSSCDHIGQHSKTGFSLSHCIIYYLTCLLVYTFIEFSCSTPKAFVNSTFTYC